MNYTVIIEKTPGETVTPRIRLTSLDVSPPPTPWMRSKNSFALEATAPSYIWRSLRLHGHAVPQDQANLRIRHHPNLILCHRGTDTRRRTLAGRMAPWHRGHSLAHEPHDSSDGGQAKKLKAGQAYNDFEEVAPYPAFQQRNISAQSLYVSFGRKVGKRGFNAGDSFLYGNHVTPKIVTRSLLNWSRQTRYRENMLSVYYHLHCIPVVARTIQI